MNVATIIELVCKIILYVADCVGLYKLYTKIGEEGWVAFVPFYGEIKMFKKVYNVKAFWIYTICDIVCLILQGFEGAGALIISLVLCVVIIYYQVKYAKNYAAAFGKGKGFAVLTFLFPAAIYLYSGYSKDVAYIGNMSEQA